MIISCQNESSLHLRAVHCHLILWEQPFFMVNLTDEKETEITKKKSKIRSTKTKNLLRSKKNLLQIGRGLPDGLPLADPPLETIRIITEQENQKCDLHVNQNFNIFVPEKDINVVCVKTKRGQNHSTIISLKFYKKRLNIRLRHSTMFSKNYSNVIWWHSDHFYVYRSTLKKHER